MTEKSKVQEGGGLARVEKGILELARLPWEVTSEQSPRESCRFWGVARSMSELGTGVWKSSVPGQVEARTGRVMRGGLGSQENTDRRPILVTVGEHTQTGTNRQCQPTRL